MEEKKRVFKLGMDVHSSSYTLCMMERTMEDNVIVASAKDMPPDAKLIVKFVKGFLKEQGLKKADCDIVCGYEAGCLGYSLYRELKHLKYDCVILAPTSLTRQKGVRQKNDWRDAVAIANDMCNNSYSSVWVLDQQDEDVRDLIRCRDDAVEDTKRCKQQIIAFLRRRGKEYDKTPWTNEHYAWMEQLTLAETAKNTLTYYLSRLTNAENLVEQIEVELEEISLAERYVEPVSHLKCFLGIRTYTALALVTEVGDFTRFETADKFAAFLGLVPHENSSGDGVHFGSITKAGNGNLRKKLIESASGICRGRVGAPKSRELQKRQAGNPADVIDYADRANNRLRRRYWKLYNRGLNRNKAVTAIARELACFIWGMMVGAIAPRAPRKLA